MIKVGIAGFGKMGKLRYELLKKEKNAEVVGIYEIKNNFEDSNKFLNNEFKCKTFDELINLDLDAVFICTYPSHSAEYTIKCLRKGINVFCEKPPSISLEELTIVKDSLDDNQVVLKYGFNHRYHYSVIEAKKIIESGELGKLIWIRGVYGKAGSLDFNLNWRNYKKHSGGGILIDQGIHMIDLIRYLSQQNFTKVFALVQNLFWDIESEDNVFATLQSDSNLTAMIHSSATQWRHKFLLEMCFEEGYINIDGFLSQTRSYAPEKLIVGRREFEDITFAMGKPKENVTWFENDDSWQHEIDEFINAISGKKKIKNGNIQDAMETMKLVDEIYKSKGF